MQQPVPSACAAYLALEQRFRRYLVLGHVMDTLVWDQVTVMPRGAASVRAEQLGELTALRTELLTRSEVSDLLDEADASDSLDGTQRLNLREMRRRHRDSLAVPGDLAAYAASIGVVCEARWREARDANDFSVVEGAFSEVVSIWREIASAKADAIGCSRYEALVDQYEPDADVDLISSLMDDIETWLPSLLDDALARQGRQCPPRRPRNVWTKGQQQEFFRYVMSTVGFDFSSGRFDESGHPCSLGQAGDVRVTARWDDESLLFGLKAVMHETGHSLYDSGTPAGWMRQPLGLARGQILHESQSLLYEVQLGRSRAFLEWLAAAAARHAGTLDSTWNASNLLANYRRVARSLIRIDADELTYPGHVMMRFRLERELMEGRLSVGDLPGAWNNSFLSILGVPVPDDRAGCLQDIHWYKGTWGYFAVYVPGAIAAAQLFQAASDGVPDLYGCVRLGKFQPLLSWLRVNVHSKGSRWTTEEVMLQATGSGLRPAVLRYHLESRYLGDV